MRHSRVYPLTHLTAGMLLVLSTTSPLVRAEQAAEPQRKPDVRYVPTPQEVVDAMLVLARVSSEDVVYDLGCGDGRIVITAAKKHGAHGVGIDIDPARIREAEANASKEGVTDLVRFQEADLFESDISDATIVSLYLLPSLNLKLRPKLWRELAVGTRVVSHAFDMDTWEPDKMIEVGDRKIYLWTITEEIKRQLPASD